MALTPQPELGKWMLAVLARDGGSATRQSIIQSIARSFGSRLTDEDWESASGYPAKWMMRLSWERADMVKDGVLKTPEESQTGTWTLTEAGRRASRRFASGPAQSSADPLKGFKPRNDSDYLARIEGLILLKSRTHERLLTDFAAHVARQGFYPNNAVHPRDLTLSGDDEWLVEAKVLYNGNATDAVRAVIGQLLTYAHFHYVGGRPLLLALFNEPVGVAFVDLLETLKISSVWFDGGAWDGSKTAKRHGLV